MSEDTDYTNEVLDDAAKLAEPFEGFSATPYRCPAGVWTIGYGSTHDASGAPVTASTTRVTTLQAHGMMMHDLRAAMAGVEASAEGDISSKEEAAMVDFVYNCGVGNFNASTLLKKLNAGDHAGAALEFAKWNKGGGKVLAGLVRRRAAETALFRGPD